MELSGARKTRSASGIDGMDYVFTMLMTDPSEFDGGQFHFFLGRPEDFIPGAVSDDQVRTAPLGAVGDAIFVRGSHIRNQRIFRGFRGNPV